VTPALDLYIDPIEGAWGSGQSGDSQNTNTNNDLIVTNGNLDIARSGVSGGDRRAFLKFDLSGIPTNAAVHTATLWLYLEVTEPWGGAYLRRVTARDWSVTNVTYSLGSDSSSVSLADFAPYPPVPGWYPVDVTAPVADWVSGPAGNFGFALRGAEGWTVTSRQFSSTRGPAAQLPQLVMAYSASTPPSPPPGLAFSGIVARAPSQLVLTWPSEANRLYSLQTRTNFAGAWVSLATNLPATPPLNSYTGMVGAASQSFYRLKLQ